MNSLFDNQGPFSVNEILKVCLYVEKNKNIKKKIHNISNLNDAKKNELVFFENLKYLDDLKNTKASFCLIKENHVKYLNSDVEPIISTNPLLDFILISNKFYPEANNDKFFFRQSAKFKKYNKNNTFINKEIIIGKNFDIGINSVIKKNVSIGDNVKIGSNCVISNAKIGNNVTINDGSVIGKIGYGFKYLNGEFFFIPHLGSVIIEDNVYIGSNCTIDRGSFSNTFIGKNSMLDNQIHIAHNVKIGKTCMIAGQVGIAGSTSIGNNCMIGGQAGISGHLKIGNFVHIAGHSGVLHDIEDNKKVMGYPAEDVKKFLKRSKYDK
jgi:UDP-3-O-[3-hydroxymyristoyl] glucosamine N-acyltransferase